MWLILNFLHIIKRFLFSGREEKKLNSEETSGWFLFLRFHLKLYLVVVFVGLKVMNCQRNSAQETCGNQ